MIIQGIRESWLQSYLMVGRSQYVWRTKPTIVALTCAVPRGQSWGPHSLYIHCRLDLSDWKWKRWLVTTHVCRQYAGVCMAPIVLLQSTPSRQRSPSVSALSPAGGWSLTDCHWTVTKRKLYGARQVDDNTSCRVQLCQLTALYLSERFRRPPPVAPGRHSVPTADRHVPDAGSQPCANPFGLWQ